MYLTPYTKSKLQSSNFQRCKLQKILEEFRDSDMDCAKIEGWEYKDANTCAASFAGSIKRFNVKGIRAISRQGEVFPIKEEMDNVKHKV